MLSNVFITCKVIISFYYPKINIIAGVYIYMPIYFHFMLQNSKRRCF